MRTSCHATLGAILAVNLVAAVFAAPAGAAIPAGNLLVNPGAEAGPGIPGATGTAVSPPPGWTTTPTFTAVAYGSVRGPTVADSAALNGGANYFAGGDTLQAAFASQTVDVSVAAPEIDANGVAATVGALLGGFETQRDNATITATFFDAAGAVLGSGVAGPVTAEDRGNITGLQQRSTTTLVPPGTRSIAATLTANPMDGTYNDGYADNASLALGVPPILGESLTAGVVSGTVLVREPGASGFHPIQGSESIPIGSSVDATEGRVPINSATTSGELQSTDFYDGRFNAHQAGNGFVTATLEGARFGSCGGSKGTRRASQKLARLWSSGGGKARTRGRRGAGTVRGTVWLTEERCKGTFFKVEEGVVRVRDFERKRNVTLRAGDSYLARAG